MDLINFLPDHILLNIMVKVPKATFIHLPEVCKNFNRIFSLLMQNNQMLKKKYELDGDVRDLISPFSNKYIEKSNDYWIEMFKMGLNSVKELGKELPTRLKWYEDWVNYQIFDNQVYWLEIINNGDINYYKEIIRIADIQSPLQYTLVKQLPKNYSCSIPMSIMAPKVGNRFIPNPHIFRHHSPSEYEILIYDKKANKLDLLIMLEVPFNINYPSMKICDNFILIKGYHNIGVYKIFGISPNKSEIKSVGLLKYDSKICYLAIVEFYRDGFLVLYDDVLEYYSLQNGVTKIFTNRLEQPFLKRSKYNCKAKCVRGKIFLYFKYFDFDKIYLLDRIETNPTFVVIAENYKDRAQFYIFIEKRIEFGINFVKKDQDVVEKFEQKSITSSIEELKLVPHKFSDYENYDYFKPSCSIKLNKSSMVLENVLSFIGFDRKSWRD